ncbi:MAG: tetratricopeptide repeat protein [Myxococcales bacterium]|nr:tetratricopeptide repeat protein [Myxococcales bacterium]
MSTEDPPEWEPSPELRAWAAERQRPRPTAQEAGALVARAERRRWWRRGRFGLVVLLPVAAALLSWVLLRSPGVQPVATPVAAWTAGTHEVDGDQIEISEGGRVQRASPTELVLQRGEVRVTARPRPADDALAVVVGERRVEVVGTLFTVTAEPFGVVVTEGVVVVTDPPHRAVLRAGERYPAVADVAPAAPVDVPAPAPSAVPELDGLRRAMVRGDRALALQGLLQRVAADDADADSWVLIAQVHAAEGRQIDALAAWRNVIVHGRARQVQRARFESAVLLEAQPDQVVPLLQAFLRDPGPLEPEALLRLGLAQRALGDEAATDTLQTLIRTHPGTDAAVRARTVLGATP